MAKGGARAHSGPAPDPSALRRDRKDDASSWLTLPRAGRPGKPPAWPLSGQLDREADLWALEWRRPQAVMWERNAQQVEVALYVRALVRAEAEDAPVTLLTYVKQMQEVLGLSLPGLKRERWRIESASEQAASSRTGTASKRAQPVRTSARSRLKVVRSDGDA